MDITCPIAIAHIRLSRARVCYPGLFSRDGVTCVYEHTDLLVAVACGSPNLNAVLGSVRLGVILFDGPAALGRLSLHQPPLASCACCRGSHA